MALPDCQEAGKCNFPHEDIAPLNKAGVLLLRKKAVWILYREPEVHCHTQWWQAIPGFYLWRPTIQMMLILPQLIYGAKAILIEFIVGSFHGYRKIHTRGNTA